MEGLLSVKMLTILIPIKLLQFNIHVLKYDGDELVMHRRKERRLLLIQSTGDNGQMYPGDTGSPYLSNTELRQRN